MTIKKIIFLPKEREPFRNLLYYFMTLINFSPRNERKYRIEYAFKVHQRVSGLVHYYSHFHCFSNFFLVSAVSNHPLPGNHGKETLLCGQYLWSPPQNYSAVQRDSQKWNWSRARGPSLFTFYHQWSESDLNALAAKPQRCHRYFRCRSYMDSALCKMGVCYG